ncbi:hypothetical protein I4F81_005016 [Pyropia yezoensis]|uniref:Uncharacterized protein n=1 Tax=Pyropia yezoensis TaxID=2788 RepID=A0ACC3BX23_PYRYE|nr:hypothetical protein I4F81_005016 [Neopyropia yezoensis]|eukprot:contig_25405_g6265
MPSGYGFHKEKMKKCAESGGKRSSGSGSHLLANRAAMSIQCKVCRQTFMCTTSRSLLEDHVARRHESRSYDECFDE